MSSHRSVLLLAVAQALAMSCSSLMISTSPLVGRMLSPDPALATLPFSLQLVATTLSTMPASLLMQRYGRRAGFLAGAATGILGAALAALAIWLGSFVLFCVGIGLGGMFAATSLFYRFAAAEAAEEGFRDKATSWVLAGGVVAAFLGPQIATLSRDALPVPFLGAYVALMSLPLAVMLPLALAKLPRPHGQSHAHLAIPLRSVLLRPVVATAILCSTVSFAGMAFVMTATPLAMAACGFEFPESASVIQWHILAMYLPSFFTAQLVARLGLLPMMGLGAVLMAGCVAVALMGVEFEQFWGALFLLGVGWNFLYVGATLMLNRALAPEERAKAQGANEFIVFGSTAAGSLTAGALQATAGWDWVNLAVLPALLVAGLALARLGWRQRRTATA